MTSPFCFYYIALALPIPFYFLARTKRSRAWMAFWLPVISLAVVELLCAYLPALISSATYEQELVLRLIAYGLGQKHWLYALNICMVSSLLAYLLCIKLGTHRCKTHIATLFGLALLCLLLAFQHFDRVYQILPRCSFHALSNSMVADPIVQAETTDYYRQQTGVGDLALQPAKPSIGAFVTSRDIPVYADATVKAACLQKIAAGTQFTSGLELSEFAGTPTVKRGWRSILLKTVPRQRGYIRLSDLLGAFEGTFLYRSYIRYALLTSDLNHYLLGYYLSPDYYRCFIPYEQYVLYLAIASLTVAEAVACIRKRRR